MSGPSERDGEVTFRYHDQLRTSQDGAPDTLWVFNGMRNSRRAGLVVLIAAVLSDVAHAGTLRKIWDFKISAVSGAEGGADPLWVFAIGFSRGGEKVAALVGRSGREQWVLVLDSHVPSSHFSKLNVNPRLTEHGLGADKRIEWSPSGGRIILLNTITDVASGATCSMPPVAAIPGYRFFGNNQVVGYDPHTRRVRFFDLDCHPTGGWVVPETDSMQTYDVYPESGLMILRRRG